MFLETETICLNPDTLIRRTSERLKFIVYIFISDIFSSESVDMSIKFSFIVLATVLLVLVCVEARSMGSKTRSALAKFKLRQALMHSGKRSANLHNTLQDDDVVNSCILTCVKCSNGEIDDESTDGVSISTHFQKQRFKILIN